MKIIGDKKFLSVCAAAFLGLAASCEMETSQNGDLDGFWHLEQVDTLSTGGVCDYSGKRIFWGVQHKLISVSDYDGMQSWRGYYFRFAQTGDSLVLNTPYRNLAHQEKGGDVPVTEVNDSLRRCGFNSLEERFWKEQLSGSKMVLRNKSLRLKFVKF